MASGFFEVLALKSKKDKEKTQRMLVAFARLLTQYFKDFRPKTMWGSIPFGYTTMESARTSDWFNNNQYAIRDTAGSWHRIYMRSGTTNVKTHFIKIRIDNIGYPKPCAVGEFRVYARPTPGVELPSSSYKLLQQTTNIISPENMLDGTVDHHAYIDGKKNGGAWIELDREYPIAAIQVDLHTERTDGAPLSFYAYGTPAGGTHEGYYEKTAPPGAVVGFEKNPGYI